MELRHIRYFLAVAEEMNFTKASVSRAMSILKRDNYIIMEPDGRILLTEAGKTAAESVYERHRFLTKWLIQLGVTPRWRQRTPAASSTTSARRLRLPETHAGGGES